MDGLKLLKLVEIAMSKKNQPKKKKTTLNKSKCDASARISATNENPGGKQAEPTTHIPDPHAGWAEDWSDPSKFKQMSPIVPLVWFGVVLLLLIVYGALSA